jgi:hypothetical protein
MKPDFSEQSVLFVSSVKWVVLAAIVGAVVGFSTSFFLKLSA